MGTRKKAGFFFDRELNLQELWVQDGRIAPWVVERIERAKAGELIGLVECAAARSNSYERYLLMPWLDDEAFVVGFRHIRANCAQYQVAPSSTYEEALIAEWGEQAEKRLARLSGYRLEDLPTLETAVAEVEKGWTEPEPDESRDYRVERCGRGESWKVALQTPKLSRATLCFAQGRLTYPEKHHRLLAPGGKVLGLLAAQGRSLAASEFGGGVHGGGAVKEGGFNSEQEG